MWSLFKINEFTLNLWTATSSVVYVCVVIIIMAATSTANDTKSEKKKKNPHALTSRILFLGPSLTFPAMQQWDRAFWMMCLFDFALGSLYNRGPGGDDEEEKNKKRPLLWQPQLITEKNIPPQCYALSFD